MDEKEQRQLLARIREELTSADASPWDALDDVWQWQEQDNPYATTLRKDSDLVLPAIAFWVNELGSYPPPEILIAFVKLFRLYMDAAGSVTLEEVFFGPPKQRLGSYSRRTAIQNQSAPTDIQFRFAFVKAKKMLGMKSDAQAATYAQREVEQKLGSCPDAETMLKRIRRQRTRTK